MIAGLSWIGLFAVTPPEKQRIAWLTDGNGLDPNVTVL